MNFIQLHVILTLVQGCYLPPRNLLFLHLWAADWHCGLRQKMQIQDTIWKKAQSLTLCVPKNVKTGPAFYGFPKAGLVQREKQGTVFICWKNGNFGILVFFFRESPKKWLNKIQGENTCIWKFSCRVNVQISILIQLIQLVKSTLQIFVCIHGLGIS